MMATGFMGYVLPWGQMSFWAATVITNLFSAIPIVGDTIVTLAVGRLCGRQPDAQPLLLAALPAAVRHRRRGRAARLGAARRRAEQSDRHRAAVGQGHRRRSRPTRPIKDAFVLVGVHDPVRLVRVLRPELSRPFRQLHPGQSGGDADRTSCRNGTTCRSTRSCARSRTSSVGVMALGASIVDARLPAVARHLARCARRAIGRSIGSSSGCS